MNHANKTFTAYRVLTAYRDSYRVFYHVPADGTAADETGRIAALLHRRGDTSTTEDVLSGIDLHGKRILVTGVSAGLGVETARSLTTHGANVIGTARDLDKAEAATGQIRKDAAANGGSFGLVELDLASLASVRTCAA